MQDMLEEEDTLIRQLPIYNCNTCRAPAQHPVLPPCGHLHCWKCVYLHNQCPACDAHFDSDDLFALFVDHGELAAEGLPLPPKPKPKYLGRIRNSSALVSEGTFGLRYQDNMSQGVELAGYGYCPPLLINSLANFDEQAPEEQSLKFPFKRMQWLLLLFVILIVWLA